MKTLFGLLILSSTFAWVPAGSRPHPAHRASLTRQGQANLLMETVATVGKRKITRKEVLQVCAELNGSFANRYVASRYAHLPERMAFSQLELCQFVFADPEAHSLLENATQALMIDVALAEAGHQHHIMVTETEVKQQIHEDLDVQRRSMGWPEMQDEELAERLQRNLAMLSRLHRRNLWTQRLTRADLEERLGHPLGPDDFYSVHALYVAAPEIPGKSEEQDWLGTEARLKTARTEILAGKYRFEEQAEALSLDASRSQQGDLGAVVRTSLPKEIEETILQLKPGEIAPPLRHKKGYLLVRLDKQGKEIDEAARQKAVIGYTRNRRHTKEAIARILKNIVWTSTLGKTPEWFRQTNSTTGEQE